MLLEKIKSDLKQAMLAKNEPVMSTLRMIIGEVPRLNKKAGEEATDLEIETIIRKLIKSELLVLEHSGVDPDESIYIKTLNSYIPKLMSKAQIQTWIMDNLDMSEFNPKMKAMGSIMKNLKGKADGNLVKQVLTEWS
jgi:uncharacterized protein YqeY